MFLCEFHVCYTGTSINLSFKNYTEKRMKMMIKNINTSNINTFSFFFDFFLISYSFYIHSFLIHWWYANKIYVSLLLEASISLAYLYHFFSFRNEIWFVYANCCFFRYLYCIFLKVSLSSRKFFELIFKNACETFLLSFLRTFTSFYIIIHAQVWIFIHIKN